MGYFGYYDGAYVKTGDLRLPLTDRAVYFGDGVYDAVLGFGERFYLLEEHLKRFLQNVAAIDLSLPYTEGRIRAVIETLAEGTHGTTMLYLQATRSAPMREHAPREEGAHLLITLTPTDAPTAAPITLVGEEDRRYDMCHVKTLNLLPNVLAARRARELHADEAVFLSRGVVRECSRSNIAVVLGGTLLTHPTDEHILPGIMRARLLHTAKRLAIPTEERPFTERELMRAEGVIVTSTTKIARLATHYDGYALPAPDVRAAELVRTMHRDFADFCRVM